MESVLLTPRELSDLLKLGRNKTYELIASGQIPVLRFGRAIRIPRSAVEQWIEQAAGVPGCPRAPKGAGGSGEGAV
jgi:excisionase family DNA binding protein